MTIASFRGCILANRGMILEGDKQFYSINGSIAIFELSLSRHSGEQIHASSVAIIVLYLVIVFCKLDFAYKCIHMARLLTVTKKIHGSI